ncbi:MAG: cell envelope biogenesis protein TolA [Bradyrhizobium sp.]|uniref:cell envelope biogenesis protein TolA n=1 Tax=Bradyrhizobium sp. TaxID=376 RepID=UPI002732093F|nr:cell envelope biogenesis protein TolA [Bradyrhizobium sp.]MDP1865480.1 cell envelope biogenesis protein TolA [Bradyrhizobium sp.]
MARKLKTYQTSIGFFDMAIAAPSMKAALQAWGSKSNLFHQGFANEAGDPDVIAATLAKPGVILRRPVGSDGAFRENAGLPSDPSGEKVKVRPKRPAAKPGKRSARKIDDQAAREASLAYEREQKQRESQQRKEEAGRSKQRERREQAVAKAQAAIDEAGRVHEQRAGEIESERAALKRRAQAEDDRWNRQKAKLETALRRARD